EVITPTERVAPRSVAASQDLAPALHGIRQLRLDLGALFFGVERPHLGRRVGAAAELEAPGTGDHPGDELVCDAVEDVDPLDRQAGLAGVEEAPDGHVLRRQVQVRVVADDGGIRAAQFEGDVLELVRGGPGDLLAGASLTREADLANERIADELFAHHAARASDDVQDTWWQSAVEHQLGQPYRR